MGKKMGTTAGASTIYTRQAEPDYTLSAYKNPRSSLPGIISFPSLLHTFFPLSLLIKSHNAFL